MKIALDADRLGTPAAARHVGRRHDHTDAARQRGSPRSERNARPAGAERRITTRRPSPPCDAAPSSASRRCCSARSSRRSTRITSFGLADLRGAVDAGFDEGAWITTPRRSARCASGRSPAWLGVVFGARRVLLSRIGVRNASALIPFAPDLASVLVGQSVAGLASGTFIPLTIGFVRAEPPAGLWPYGIAVYALNLELSLNIPASLEGWYVDHLSWHWIFWQYVCWRCRCCSRLLRHAAPAG